MMRDEEEDIEAFRPPAWDEVRFSSRIEQDLGYAIEDTALRDSIADEVYNPKPQPTFGFDPTIDGADPSNAGQPMVAHHAAYMKNEGSLLADADEDQPTNLVATNMGYVMPKSGLEADTNDLEEEVNTKFGRATPQDGDFDDDDDDSASSEEEVKKKKKKKKDKENENDSPHKPYSALDTVDEDSEMDVKKPSKSSRPGGPTVDRIKVAVRMRPLNQDEMVSKSKKKKDVGPEAFMGWEVDEDGDLDVLIQKGTRSKVEGKSMFHVDRIFEEQDKVETLYSEVCQPIMNAVLNGQHGTIFGYGQTGGGKSYTIQGGKGARGMIQIAAKDLFQRIAEDSDREYTVKASYIEIYNEQVRDLMGFDEDPDAKSRRATAVITTVNKLDVDLPVLEIHEDPKTGDTFVDAQATTVTSIENVKRVLHKGNRNRATEDTASNKFSSRSHAIFRLTIESHERIEENTDSVDAVRLRVASLNFVDLAGSENSTKAATSGKTKREGGKINQSLLSLTQVIHQLSLPPKKRPKHINYRDSKLTRILQPHLSGNAAISIICCCSPAKKAVEETRMALKFAYNAKRIKLKPRVNEVMDDKALVENLKKELAETRMKLRELKDFKEKNPAPPPRAETPGRPSGKSEFPMIDRFFAEMNAQMNAYMNASVRSIDFQDAVETLSALTMGSGNKDAGPPVPAVSDGGGGIDNEAEPTKTPDEEDEDEVEAFRRQILAKFMSEMEELEEDADDGDNVDTTLDDTAVNDTTMADTTIGGTTLGDATVENDASMNRTFADVTSAPESAPTMPQPPPKPTKAAAEASLGGNARDVFRSKPHAAGSRQDFTDDAKRSFVDSDESSASTPQMPPNESDLNLIERFRAEILEKFRDEIVDEEAAHELDENAQNVAVIANELINKFKREIVYKFKDEFPELLVKRVEMDLAAARVGDNGIVGRVIQRSAVDQGPGSDGQLNTTDDDSADSGSVEKFEDEFDEDIKEPEEDKHRKGRKVPTRTFSTQTDGAVINGTGNAAKNEQPSVPPVTASSMGQGMIGSVSSDLSSDVANKKQSSATSPLPANPPPDTDDEDDMIPPGEIAVGGKKDMLSAEGKMRIKFLEEKLLATDELVETLFVELENAKTFIRELVFENAGGGGGGGLDHSGAALFGSAGTSGVTVVDEQILNQCEILKFGIYTSLLFFVFGQHELFLATVFFLWLSLEVATKT